MTEADRGGSLALNAVNLPITLSLKGSCVGSPSTAFHSTVLRADRCALRIGESKESSGDLDQQNALIKREIDGWAPDAAPKTAM